MCLYEFTYRWYYNDPYDEYTYIDLMYNMFYNDSDEGISFSPFFHLIIEVIVDNTDCCENENKGSNNVD